MRKILLIVAILVLVILPGLGCLTSKPAPAPAAGPTEIQQIQALQAYQAANEAWKSGPLTADLAAKNAAIDGKYSKADVDNKIKAVDDKVVADAAKIADLQNQINALKTPTNPINPSIPGVPPTAQGTVSATIQNIQEFYQFPASNQSYVSVRLFNNRSDARYVNFTMRLTSYGSSASGALTPAVYSGATLATPPPNGSIPIVFQITNPTVNQPVISFSYNASPVGNITNVYFFPTSGGFNGSGEYYLGSGQSVDMLICIQINSTIASMWKVAVTASDRAINL